MFSVLIVEDDPMVAMINEQYVQKNKHFKVVKSCRNGQDALQYLENNKVDLIVLDVFMPLMDGVETLKKIRENKITSEVIMVTAANDSSTLEDTMHLGVIDYLIKPFAYERFQIALEKFETKINSIKSITVLDQNSIDSILANAPSKKDKVLPKGIQENTLKLIENYFKDNKSWQSGDMISENLGISIVTIRHYMNYLVESKQVTESVNYGTGGRPCMLYKWGI